MIQDHRDENSDEATALAPGPGPLPPIPDGGLAKVMPGWLRQGLVAAELASAETAKNPTPALDASLDPAGFITEADLPDWLRQLGRADSPPPSAVTNAAPPRSASPAMSAHTATGMAARTPTPVPTAPKPIAAVGRRIDSAPAPAPAAKPGNLPRPSLAPTRPLAVVTTSPQAPSPAEQQDGSNRAVAITGIVLVVIVGLILVYLFATGVL